MTVTARFEFPSGRYHATPWGRHVNEGAVEWPPSPWRLLRALIWVGFNRLGWSEGDLPRAAALIDRLAEVQPRYSLPEARSAHSRHYMPLFKEKTTRVLDAFAVVDRLDAPLWVQWEVSLTETERVLLGELLERLPYLGRAESWVDARLAEAPEGVRWLQPGARSEGATERVDLLAPLQAGGFAAWRAERLELETKLLLDAAARVAREKGKRVPTELTAAQRKMLGAKYPGSLFDALRVDTAEIQAAGWSLPPGSRWVSYWRRPDALNAPPARSRTVSRVPEMDAVLFAVSSETRSGKVLPPLKDALRRGEVIHESLVALASKESTGQLQLTGMTEAGPARGHRHPFVLPVSFSGWRSQSSPARMEIDHVLVCVPRGERFDQVSMAALRSLRRTWAAKMSTLWLTSAWEGLAEDRSDLPWLRPAREWVSHTPFVPPRHLKRGGNNSLGGQLLAELAQRGLPTPASISFSAEVDGRIEWLPLEAFWEVWQRPGANRRLDTRWRTFQRERRVARPHIAAQPALCLNLAFAQPVVGPIALGYGCHQGLGLFADPSR